MPSLSTKVELRGKRWQEQRWILDNIIKTVGIEWDQGRIAYTLGPCGPDATPDFMGIRALVQKFNDIAREFGRAAGRREAMAWRFGIRMIYEIYKQMQYKAGPRHRKNPTIGLTHNLGGTTGAYTVSVAIFGQRD